MIAQYLKHYSDRVNCMKPYKRKLNSAFNTNGNISLRSRCLVPRKPALRILEIDSCSSHTRVDRVLPADDIAASRFSVVEIFIATRSVKET